jgi:hypothetical protein
MKDGSLKYIPIEFQDPEYRGLITFKLPEGTHDVTTVFLNTKIRTISDRISFLSLVILACLFFVEIKNKKLYV